MFNQYSYKKKFTFLIVFIIMLGIAGYKRSFGNLISLYRQNNSLQQKKELIGQQSPNIDLLNKQISDLDRLIGKEGLEKEKIQQEIISFLVNNSSGISIYDLQPIHDYYDTDYNIFTYQLDLTGNYNNLLEAAYNFEKKFEYSKIISVRFYNDKKDNKTNVLHLKLIFQNYENKK